METFAVVDPHEGCGGAWLEYARRRGDPGAGSDSREEGLQRANPVFLVEDANWRQFKDALGAQFYPRQKGFYGLARYTVTATMTGRIDAGEGERGFGHLNGSRLLFTLSSVADISLQENHFDEQLFSREPVRFPHGTISGKVIGVDGKSIGLAKVSLVAVGPKLRSSGPYTFSNADGTYSLQADPGTYLVAVNKDWPATENVPVPTTYYPSSEQVAGAAQLNLLDDSDLRDVIIKIPRQLVPRYFDVQVLGPEDAPVKAYVYLNQTGQFSIAGSDKGVTSTDDTGHARLLAFEGIDYQLSAEADAPERCAPTMLLPKGLSNTDPIVVKMTLASDACDVQKYGIKLSGK
jgi:hypothetical protein